MSGPIGIGKYLYLSVYRGSLILGLNVVVIITFNLGLINLLPIPALDGCRFLFLVIEAIRRKPLKPEVEGIVHLVGFGLLMLLMLVVTFGDISKLISGGFQ